jgi:hypothetical protein
LHGKHARASTKRTRADALSRAERTTLHTVFVHRSRCAHRAIPWKNFTLVYSLDARLHLRLKASGVASYHPPGIDMGAPSMKFSDPIYAEMVVRRRAPQG